MKKLLYIFATAALTMTMSCGNSEKAGQSEKSVEDSLRADSIKKVEMAIEAQRQDSIRQDSIRQDSLRRYRTTPDLALFELHGPVKSVIYKDGWFSNELKRLSFDESGQLISVSSFRIIRDGKNRIKSFKGSDAEEIRMTYNSQDKATKIFRGGHEFGQTTSIKYNEKGFATSAYESGMSEMLEFKVSTSYKYKNEDKFGNWTSRSCVCTTTRIYHFDVPETSKSTETSSETRTITYYER